MGTKEKTPKAFRDIVNERYKTDMIMSTPLTLVVLAMPLVVMWVVTALTNNLSNLSPLKDYMTVVIGIPFMVELFVIMVILSQLYNRLVTHSLRDKKWRLSLIEFSDKVGCDSTALRKMHKEISQAEAFASKPFIRILMFLMFVFDMVLFLFYFPQWHYEGIDYTATVMMIGVLLCVVQAVLISYSVLSFAFRHEKNQNDFTIRLSADLAKKGINVPPMIKIVRHFPLPLHIIFLILTGGLWIIFLLFMMFHNMNNHLMNQWVYENEMLKVVESHGGRRFEEYMADYHCDNVLTKRQKRKLNRKNFKQIKQKVKTLNRMPKVLYIAELFLIFLCANYMLKIIALDCEICANYTTYKLSLLEPLGLLDLHRDQWYNVIMIGVELFFLMTTISAMMGIASRRPSSWRKVVRSCVTFVIPLWFSTFLTSNAGLTHIFDLNVFVTTVLLVVILVIMVFTSSIRDFYAPFGEDMPTTAEWIEYAFHGDLGGKDVDFSVDLDDGDILQ